MMLPGVHEFRRYPEGVPTEQILYRGAKSVVVDSDRFLCPSDVEKVTDADFVAELYDKPLTWCEKMFLDREWLVFSQFEGRIKKDANKRTESDRTEEYQENLPFDSDENPVVPIVECWVKRDVLGLGEPQQFCLFLEPETKQALYYEYVAKITPDNRIPYTSISIGRQKNRWWGPGLPETAHAI